MQMQNTLWQVRRTADGSIDYAAYKRIAHAARSRAMTKSLAQHGKAARSGLVAAMRMTWMATRFVGMTFFKMGGHAIRFWMIAPLGVADQLHIHPVKD
jgi:hypothetical protein